MISRLKPPPTRVMFPPIGVRGVAWIFLLAGAAASVAESESDAEAATDPEAIVAEADLFEITEDVDLLFEDFDVVVTAGRTAQPINMSAASVSVLEADDIHASGVTTLPELFDFIPGMDVLQVDRNRWAIGVRGLHHGFTDRTLFLQDGRTINSAVTGGVDLLRFPILLEDLEQIEFVRGPGGAAWGANAFSGVVNFISKDPRETQGLLASTTINHFGDTSTYARWGDSHENLHWRLSFGYQDRESSSDAIDGSDFRSNDFSRTPRVSGEAVLEISESTTLTFGGGYAHVDRGSFSFATVEPTGDERIDYGAAHARLDHAFSEDVSGYLQLHGVFEDVNRPTLWRLSTVDLTVDGQLDFQASEDHRMSVGASVRQVYIDAEGGVSTYLLGPGDYAETWVGAFIMDRWEVTERLTLDGQFRVDDYSGTDTDWSGRLSLLYALDADQQHVVRLSGARAFRTPQVSVREFAGQNTPLPTPEFPPGLFAVQFLESEDMKNESILALEAGYMGRITPSLTLRIDGFYQQMDDLTGARLIPDPLDLPIERTLVRLDNIAGAEAWGIETELMWKAEEEFEAGLWYAFNELSPELGSSQSLRALHPSRHTVGVRARYRLSEDWTLNANYKYASPTPGDGLGNLEASEYHRIDLTALVKVLDHKGEVTFGVQDLLDETRFTVETAGDEGESFETPGRTFFVRFEYRF